jgi:signal transduction histidine kinase
LSSPQTHSLLKRQLRRCFGENFTIPPEWKDFVNSVNDAYQESDTNREMLERSLELSSRELNQANSHMRAIFQVLPDLLIRLDRQGIIMGFRGSPIRKLPQQPRELIGKHLDQTPLKFLWEYLKPLLPKVLEQGTLLQTECSLDTPERHYDMEVRLVPLFQDQVIAIVRDISDKKRVEKELRQADAQRLEFSHQAGMAEVAVDILHNVGNVLNSVNVGSSCLADRLRRSKFSLLGKVADLLKQNRGDWGAFFTQDPKGRQLPEFLIQLGEHVEKERIAALEELAELQRHIDHIKDVITMQQSYAKTCRLVETLQVTDLLEDALKMQASALARHEIQVKREFEPLPSIAVEKHKVLQILVNLIQNAKNACSEAGRLDKQIILKTQLRPQGVRILVIDNGIGIAPANRGRIFQHGFTTRKNGHGFGLHSGALAAKDLGGALTFQSDGPGLGATFQLDLPLQPPDSAAAPPNSHASAQTSPPPRHEQELVPMEK